MELILKENVAHLGFKDEIVDVKDGYGRNYLIPKGKAVLATTSAKKVLAENLKQKAFKEKAIIDEANKLAKKIEKLEIKVKTKVGPDGKLFGSISNIDISNSLADNKIDLEKDNISHPKQYFENAELYLSKSLNYFQSISISVPEENFIETLKYNQFNSSKLSNRIGILCKDLHKHCYYLLYNLILGL